MRKTGREPGKSDPTDPLAVARATLKDGLKELPVAQLDEHALEIRQLLDHRERFVSQRTALSNDLRWHMHDLDPGFQVPRRRLATPSWQQRTARKLSRLGGGARVRIARDELKRIRELTTAIDRVYRELATWSTPSGQRSYGRWREPGSSGAADRGHPRARDDRLAV